MSMRISSAAPALLLIAAACGADAPETAPAGADRIACRTGGASDFADVCTIERTSDAAGQLLTIRHPDGGFRRLRVATDGRGVIAADGAEPAVVTVNGDAGIDVALGGDAYRLPATVKGAEPAR